MVTFSGISSKFVGNLSLDMEALTGNLSLNMEALNEILYLDLDLPNFNGDILQLHLKKISGYLWIGLQNLL